MKVLAFSLVAFTLVHGGYTQHLRGAANEERHLDGEVYFQTSDPALLGAPNEMAAIGNPLKGLAGGSRYAPPPLPESVPLAIEFFNIGLGTYAMPEIVFADILFSYLTFLSTYHQTK
jgi:hypothetical protein